MKPLSRKIRILSLILMFFIFIIVGPMLLISAMGYKFDQLEDVFTIVKTGGIYIQSDVSGIDVHVDGEFVKKNGLFLRNILVEELEPDTIHSLVVEKSGLHTWKKELPVYESLVTEVSLMMLPTEIEDRKIYQYINMDNIDTVEILDQKDLLVNEEYEELLKLFDSEAEVEDLVEDNNIFDTESLKDIDVVAKEVPEYFTELGVSDPEELENLITVGNEVSWLEDGDVVINWIGTETTTPYYYCLTKDECRTKITLDWEDEILGFDFFPGRNDILIVSVDSGIYAVEVDDRSERNIQPIYLGEDLRWIKTYRDRIVVKDGDVFHELQF